MSQPGGLVGHHQRRAGVALSVGRGPLHRHLGPRCVDAREQERVPAILTHLPRYALGGVAGGAQEGEELALARRRVEALTDTQPCPQGLFQQEAEQPVPAGIEEVPHGRCHVCRHVRVVRAQEEFVGRDALPDGFGLVDGVVPQTGGREHVPRGGEVPRHLIRRARIVGHVLVGAQDHHIVVGTECHNGQSKHEQGKSFAHRVSSHFLMERGLSRRQFL